MESVCAAVVRGIADDPQLLVVDDPAGGARLPTGPLAEGAAPGDAARALVAAATGLVDVEVLASLGTWARVAGAGPQGRGGPERHVWHVELLTPTGDPPGAWEHGPGGGGAGAPVRACRWVPLDGTVWLRLAPLFTPVLDMVLAGVRRRR